MPVMRVGLQGDITGMERILGSLLAGTDSLLIKRLFVSLSVLSPQSMNVHQVFKTNWRRRQHNLLHLVWIEGTKTGAWISWKMEPKEESKFITAGVRDNCLCVFGLEGINKENVLSYSDECGALTSTQRQYRKAILTSFSGEFLWTQTNLCTSAQKCVSYWFSMSTVWYTFYSNRVAT